MQWHQKDSNTIGSKTAIHTTETAEQNVEWPQK